MEHHSSKCELSIVLVSGALRISVNREVIKLVLPSFFMWEGQQAGVNEGVKDYYDGEINVSLLIPEYVLPIFVSYLRTGDIANEITQKNVLRLLYIAQALDLQSLIRYLLFFIEDRVKHNEFTNLRSFVIHIHVATTSIAKRNYSGIESVTARYIAANVVEISKTMLFLSLHCKHIISILALEEHCNNEIALFEAAIRWIEIDVKSRLHWFPIMLRKLAVRLPLLPAPYLEKLVYHPVFSQSQQTLDFLAEAISFHTMIINLSGSKRFVPRGSLSDVVLKKPLPAIQVYNAGAVPRVNGVYTLVNENNLPSSILFAREQLLMRHEKKGKTFPLQLAVEVYCKLFDPDFSIHIIYTKESHRKNQGKMFYLVSCKSIYNGFKVIYKTLQPYVQVVDAKLSQCPIRWSNNTSSIKAQAPPPFSRSGTM